MDNRELALRDVNQPEKNFLKLLFYWFFDLNAYLHKDFPVSQKELLFLMKSADNL